MPISILVEKPSTIGRSESQRKPITSFLSHLLPSSLKASFLDIDLLQIQTANGILDEYDMRLVGTSE